MCLQAMRIVFKAEIKFKVKLRLRLIFKELNDLSNRTSDPLQAENNRII